MRRGRPLSSTSTTGSDVPHHQQPQDNVDSHRHHHQVFTYFLDRHDDHQQEEDEAGDNGNNRTRQRQQRRSTLYIPLTSYCNSQTLPATRGPNFRLPAHVVAALGWVRDVERRQDDSTSFGCQEKICRAALSSPDYNGRQQNLSPPPPSVPAVDKNNSQVDEADYYQSLNLSNRRPTVDELMVEVDQTFMKYDIAGIVIAGEGEPTLALDKLLDLLSRLRHISTNIPIRINTNGIISSMIEPGSSSSAADRLLRHAVEYRWT
jgi:hypothetical protein